MSVVHDRHVINDEMIDRSYQGLALLDLIAVAGRAGDSDGVLPVQRVLSSISNAAEVASELFGRCHDALEANATREDDSHG